MGDNDPVVIAVKILCHTFEKKADGGAGVVFAERGIRLCHIVFNAFKAVALAIGLEQKVRLSAIGGDRAASCGASDRATRKQEKDLHWYLLSIYQ